MKTKIIRLLSKFVEILIDILPNYSCKMKTKKAKMLLNSNLKKKTIFKDKKPFKYKESIDLSIIIPVYNAESFLEEALNSIINQKTKYSYEIICINDGSTDSSLDILKKYNKNIIIINTKNLGAGAARNKGLIHAKGKYISFVDSDDLIEQNYVEKCIDEVNKSNSDIVSYGIQQFESKTEKTIRKTKYNDSIVTTQNRQVLKNISGCVCGSIYRRKLWENVRFPEGCYHEDVIIKNLIFPISKKISIISDTLYKWRVNRNSLSRKTVKFHKNINKNIEFLYLIEDIINLTKELKIEIDDYLYSQLLEETSTYTWLRTRKIDNKIRKSMFIYSCEMIDKLSFNNESIIENIMKKRVYMKWRLYSFNTCLKNKYKV